jgi:MFS family permease
VHSRAVHPDIHARVQQRKYGRRSLKQLATDTEATQAAHAARAAIPHGRGYGAVLRNRPFLALWLAQVTSQTAQNCIWWTLFILISHLTGANPLSVGGIIIMQQLPTVLFSSVSGVLVDRFSKRGILMVTNFIRAAAVVGYFFFRDSGEALYAITFLVGVVSQPFAPAESATIPLIVREEQLITANSLFQATFMGSQLLGFMILGPALTQFAGIPATLMCLMALFLFAGLVLIILPPSTRVRNVASTAGLISTMERVWHELLEGSRFIIADLRLCVALVQIAFAPTLLLILAEIGPSYVRQVLGISQVNTMVFLLAPAGLGIGLGLGILGHWGSRLHKERLVVVALLALSVTILGLAAVPQLAHEFWLPFTLIGISIPSDLQRILVTLPLSLLMGIEIAFINTPAQTIVLERAAEHVRGRVLAIQQTLTSAVAIPPLLLVGAIASAAGVQGTLGLVGVVLFVIALASVYTI